MNDATDRYRLLHELNPSQARALDALDGGSTHGQAAEAAGVDRTTVSRWASRHPAFRAELKQRKADRAARNAERLQRLTEGALDAVEAAIAEGDAGSAFQWLRLSGLDAVPVTFNGPTTTEGVIESYRCAMGNPADDALKMLMGNRSTNEAMDEILRGLADTDLGGAGPAGVA